MFQGVKKDIIVCSIHGDITGYDCKSLKSKECEGCLIYSALKEGGEEEILSKFEEKEN